MTTNLTCADTRTLEILNAAIERRTPLVVSHRTERGWAAYPARLTRLDRAARNLHVALALRSDDDAPESLSTGARIGVTFRRAHKKCMFSAIILSLDADAGEFVVRLPERLQELQRRVFERTAPPPARRIPVRFWRIEDAVDGLAPDDKVHAGTLEDLSVGGARVKATGVGDLPLGETYDCRIRVGSYEDDLGLEAVLRHHELPHHGTASLGFRFIGLETTERGRQNMIRIARIVSRFQRSTSGASKIRLHRRRRAR